MGYQCWQCGQEVEPGEVQRRTVNAGGMTVWTWNASQGPWFGTRTERVSLCPECTDLQDRRAKSSNRLVVGVVLLMLAASLLVVAGCAGMFVLAWAGVLS